LAPETVEVNRPFDCEILVEHAVVGGPIEVYGDVTAEKIQPPIRIMQ